VSASGNKAMALLGGLVVLAVLAVLLLLVQGLYPVGIALLAVAIALLPPTFRAARPARGEHDAG
jgi:hypothetical protein